MRSARAFISRLGKRRILQRKHHVLRRRHVREQGVVLEHHADIALVGLAQRRDRVRRAR